MLNTDAYNRVIASLKETDEITSIAVQALLNKTIELLDQVGFDPADDDVISADEWHQAREDWDNLRYAEIEFSSWSTKNLTDEQYSAEVKTVQAYMPRGWFATLRTRGNDDGTTRQVISVTGRNNAGWTLDDYVIPRLASGNYFAKEVTVK